MKRAPGILGMTRQDHAISPAPRADRMHPNAGVEARARSMSMPVAGRAARVRWGGFFGLL
jgi:hypothetical protein